MISGPCNLGMGDIARLKLAGLEKISDRKTNYYAFLRKFMFIDLTNYQCRNETYHHLRQQ